MRGSTTTVCSYNVVSNCVEYQGTQTELAMKDELAKLDEAASAGLLVHDAEAVNDLTLRIVSTDEEQCRLDSDRVRMVAERAVTVSKLHL